ncbi:MAG: HAD family hydrolase [Syntrophobacteria bacterium]
MAARSVRLALFDIDGTLRRLRDPWRHLHRHLGLADQAKDFLVCWQRGEITYEQWADLDSLLWCGCTRQAMVAALETNPLRAGARELTGWFTSRSVPCVGISTGLSIFNDITARELGFAEVISNVLHFEGDTCKGAVSVLVREDNKAEIMDAVLERYSVRSEHVVAFGDGTADIPLLTKAGLGVAICPKNERVRAYAAHVVEEPIDSAIAIVEKHFPAMQFDGLSPGDKP